MSLIEDRINIRKQVREELGVDSDDAVMLIVDDYHTKMTRCLIKLILK